MEHQRVSKLLVDRLADTLETLGDTGGHGDTFSYNLEALLNWVDVHRTRTGSVSSSQVVS